MNKSKLNRGEKKIESDLIHGKYNHVGSAELKKIASAIARKRKDVVLNIRMNSYDLEAIKKKAKKLNIPYQTFISEILHQIAE